MIIIYTQNKTLIHKDADSAKEDMISLYGEKLGQEAYRTVKDRPAGTSYRKHGGPLITVVSREKADWIKMKEAGIEMLDLHKSSE